MASTLLLQRRNKLYSRFLRQFQSIQHRRHNQNFTGITMKSLSIKQPWAFLIANGAKPLENRTWNTKFRGQFLIHASQNFDKKGLLWVQENFGLLTDATGKDNFYCGGIIGRTNIVDCVSFHQSAWYAGDYAFVLENSEALPDIRGYEPFVPCTGKLNFFDVPKEIEFEVDNLFNEHRLCMDCGFNTDFQKLENCGKHYYMVKHELWERYGVGKKMLCMDCMEKRLGHALKAEDIFICPLTVRHNHYTRAILSKAGILDGSTIIKSGIDNVRAEILLSPILGRGPIAEGTLGLIRNKQIRIGSDRWQDLNDKWVVKVRWLQ